jgi:predicted AlkP superfamily phosphohydrolase/phosphomutase
LGEQDTEPAAKALARIIDSEDWDDFEGFSIEAERVRHANWYSVELEHE